jgi:hypothetical protein
MVIISYRRELMFELNRAIALWEVEVRSQASEASRTGALELGCSTRVVRPVSWLEAGRAGGR